jgi:hypothetical protein
MKTISRLFRIYSEASIAVIMAVGCLLELVCAFGLYAHNNPALAFVVFVAAALFAIAANGFAGYVYIDAKRSNLI